MLVDYISSKFYCQKVRWLTFPVNTPRKFMNLFLIIFQRKRYFSLQNFKRSLRYFLPFLFLLSLITTLLVPIIFTPAIAQQPRQEIRGVWMTNNDLDVIQDRVKLQDALRQLRWLNFNTIYSVVWNSGDVMYPSAVAQQAGIQPFVYKGSEGHDILTDLIFQAHSQGLLVIPWFEFGFMLPVDSELYRKHPNWFTQRQDGSQTFMSAGGEVILMNPFHPEVQKFITDLVLEIVTQHDADGIQFDDHMSLPKDFGYDKYTIALYEKEMKKKPPGNPQDVTWVRWRANKLTEFMKKLNQEVKSRKPSAIFSVSPNSYDYAYKAHLQDWLGWIREKIVDELVVQVYLANYNNFIEKISRPEIKEAQQTIPTAIGIMTGMRNNPVAMQQIQNQARSAQELGLGVAFFYYESLWDNAPESISDRQVGFQSLFPFPIPRISSHANNI
jgi:uncharacterized lipoprotein YddW (UPF0748 family)